MTETETPPVGAGGEGRISKGADASLHMAPPTPNVQPLPLKQFVVSATAAFGSLPMGGGRRGGPVRRAYVDIENALRHGDAHPATLDELIAHLRARGYGAGGDWPKRIKLVWQCFHSARRELEGGTHE